MSNIDVRINDLKKAKSELASLPLKMISMQVSIGAVSLTLDKSMSTEIKALKKFPGEFQKQIDATRKLGNALDKIINAYITAENELINDSSLKKEEWKEKEKTAEETMEGMTYEECLEYRRKNAVDENTRKLYEKYRKNIKIKDDDYEGTGHYNGGLNHIKYDADEDHENDCGAGSTYYHEVGHLIDDQSDWNSYTSTDWSYDFYDKLQSDYDNWIKKIMKEQGYTDINDAYDYASNWLWKDADNKGGISDIVIGLSDGEAGGRWGHNDDYYNKGSISKEAFAHFFEAGMSADPTKLEYIKEIFPSAYAEYQKMIQDELK